MSDVFQSNGYPGAGVAEDRHAVPKEIREGRKRRAYDGDDTLSGGRGCGRVLQGELLANARHARAVLGRGP